jgi:hypothetical protein
MLLFPLRPLPASNGVKSGGRGAARPPAGAPSDPSWGVAPTIENPTGAITIYRKNNKPALGPACDSLDDIDPSGWRP